LLFLSHGKEWGFNFGGGMTRLEEYYKDLDKLWCAIGLLGSILGCTLLILVAHLIWGRG